MNNLSRSEKSGEISILNANCCKSKMVFPDSEIIKMMNSKKNYLKNKNYTKKNFYALNFFQITSDSLIKSIASSLPSIFCASFISCIYLSLSSCLFMSCICISCRDFSLSATLCLLGACEKFKEALWWLIRINLNNFLA